MLPGVVAELRSVSECQVQGSHHDGEKTRDLLHFEVSDGASCIFLNGQDKPPTIVQKRDGSYLYATTDLAALKQRQFCNSVAISAHWTPSCFVNLC